VTFTWDPRKAEANRKKHGVDFREAATVFDDPFSVAFPDPDHSVSEARFLIVGMSALGRVLVASYIEVDDDIIRIISARTATTRERKFYEEDSNSRSS
jgi:uncharacterized DUF497 family protein